MRLLLLAPVTLMQMLNKSFFNYKHYKKNLVTIFLNLFPLSLDLKLIKLPLLVNCEGSMLTKPRLYFFKNPSFFQGHMTVAYLYLTTLNSAKIYMTAFIFFDCFLEGQNHEMEHTYFFLSIHIHRDRAV